MENSNEVNTNVEQTTEKDTATDAVETKNTKDTKANGTEESVTLSKVELDKKIQSAEDKLRTSYSKKIKELEDKVKELSPVQKSDTELEIEKRLEELEKSQKEVNEQKAFLSLQDALQGKGIDKKIAAYLKDGVDVEEFATLFGSVLNESTKSKGYVPDGHNSDDKITIEEFKAMKYSEKEKVMRETPELYKRLMEKIKRQ